jgi:chromatin remodeling complex protein RSC6
VSKKAVAPVARAAGKPSQKKEVPSAFRAPVKPSPVLAVIVGVKPLPRQEVTKKVWDYIKRQNLQDKDDRRLINADDKLRAIFDGIRQINQLRLASFLSRHLVK